MKGLIIDTNYDNAENIKIIAENMCENLQLEILNQKTADFCLIDASEYDFILTSVKPVKARALLTRLRPFMRVVMDKSTDYVCLNKHNETILIDRNKIIGIEVIEKNCYIHTTNDRIEVSRITLTNLLEMLEIPYVVRCHKSYAVNVKYVKGFKRETRTRWHTRFIIETDFDCRVTDVFMKEVMDRCVEFHGIMMSKKIGY